MGKRPTANPGVTSYVPKCSPPLFQMKCYLQRPITDAFSISKEIATHTMK